MRRIEVASSRAGSKFINFRSQITTAVWGNKFIEYIPRVTKAKTRQLFDLANLNMAFRVIKNIITGNTSICSMSQEGVANLSRSDIWTFSKIPLPEFYLGAKSVFVTSN